jgi:hypothetical protein
MGWFKKDTVQVEFVDADTGAAFAQSDIPLAQLPESFELETTMHLGDEEWSVVDAAPKHSTEFAKTGSLRLTLRRAQHIDPANLLFSLPTINDAIPGLDESSSRTGRTLEIHEDDWRQVELVSARLRPAIDTDLAHIRDIYASKAKEYGFTEVHVRRAVPEPLPGVALRLDDLWSRFPSVTPHAGLTYEGAPYLIDGSFAAHVDAEAALAGTQRDGVATAVCLLGWSSPSDAVVTALASVMQEFDLLVVDWCRGGVADADGVGRLFGAG